MCAVFRKYLRISVSLVSSVLAINFSYATEVPVELACGSSNSHMRWLAQGCCFGPPVSSKLGVCRSEATAKLGLAGSDPTGLFGNPQVKPPRMFRAGGFTWGLLSSGGVGPRQRSRRARRARTAPVLILGRCAKNLRGVSRDQLASRHPARRSLAWSGFASGRCAPPGPAGPLAAKGAPPSGWTCEYGR